MRFFLILLLFSLFVACTTEKPAETSKPNAKVDSLQAVTDSMDSAPNRKVGYTGKHMHGTSFGSSDPAKDAHQDTEKKYRLRRNLGKARARGRAAHKKAEEARRQLMKPKSEADSTTGASTDSSKK